MRLLVLACALLAAYALDSATFQITKEPMQSRSISQRFVGFSIEVGSTPAVFLVGGLGGSPRPSFAAVLNGLRVAAGSSKGANIRVGGNSADNSAWVPAPKPLPVNTTYRITSADLSAYAAAVPRWAGTVTLDTTLRYGDDPSLAVAHVTAAGQQLGWELVEGIEIGNEMDLFFENGIRKPDYNYADYKREFAHFNRDIGGVQAGRTQGGTWCSSRWATEWSDYVTTFADSFASLSFHHYTESVCNGNKATVPGLLSPNASLHFIQQMKPLAAIAAKAQIPFYIGEGNSVSCGGKAGVSDVFASALWAVDILFTAASLGMERWNFHGCPSGAYATIAYPDIKSDVPEVRPMYYGLLAFAEATANKSIIQVVHTSAKTSPYIKCWAVTDSDKATRVVVLHTDPAADAGSISITIAPPGPLRRPAILKRLLAGGKGMDAVWSDAISWGGLTWNTSKDGLPSGTPTTETIQADAHGQYVFELHKASMVLLTLPML
jgi:hypothetical protein